MLDQQVAADVVGRSRTPHAEQLLTSVHDAYVLINDNAEWEKSEQQLDGYGWKLQTPVESMDGRVLVNERAVIEVQPVLDENVLQTNRRRRRSRRRRLVRGYCGRGRLLTLQHADLEVCVIHLLGDLVQLPCETSILDLFLLSLPVTTTRALDIESKSQKFTFLIFVTECPRVENMLKSKFNDRATEHNSPAINSK